MGRLVEISKAQGLKPTVLSKAVKANRDQNSSVPVTHVWKMPNASHKAASITAQTRSGSFAGKSRGVGRHQTRDQNSSPGTVSISARTPQGKYVSHVNDLDVFHVRPRHIGSSQNVFHTGRKVSKSDDRKGTVRATDTAGISAPAGARVGRKIR